MNWSSIFQTAQTQSNNVTCNKLNKFTPTPVSLIGLKRFDSISSCSLVSPRIKM